MKRIALALLAAAIFSGLNSAYAQVVKEEIFFLGRDGRSYEQYSGLRTDYGSYNLFMDKGETLDDYLYFFPNEFRWDRTDADNDIIRLSQGDYSSIVSGAFDEEIETAENGDLIFKSAAGEDPQSSRYGYWNTPADFSQFVYAWVMPDNFEIVDAQSNREGEWVRRNNTLAWFGSNVNNVSFTIRYRAKTAATFEALSTAVGGREGVALGQTQAGVRLTLADTILFPSGSAELSAAGRELVGELAGAVDFGGGLRAVIEGHTDNAPISGALSETYPTNWELSAARAIAVVRAMEAAGAPGESLEARALGEHDPVADNDTAEGRAANRRIAILISGSEPP